MQSCLVANSYLRDGLFREGVLKGKIEDSPLLEASRRIHPECPMIIIYGILERLNALNPCVYFRCFSFCCFDQRREWMLGKLFLVERIDDVESMAISRYGGWGHWTEFGMD